MDLSKNFHMKGGLGDTAYPKNSSLQKRVSEKVKHITLEALEKMYVEMKPKSIGIADMGCSSGPNTLSNLKDLVDVLARTCRAMREPDPEIRIYLNDLPTNDFNTVFQALPDFYRELKDHEVESGGPSVYVAAYPGTFYGRLFPYKTLHFVYSSNSLHWLSRQVPPSIYNEEKESINKKSIYISERSPSRVSEAYLKQFEQDLSLFLKSRSEEVVSGGQMVLILLARTGPSHLDRGISLLWEILYQALATLVAQGEVEEERLESYEVNFYAASKEELEEEVRKEGSFKIEVIEKFEMDSGNMHPTYGVAVAKAVRSIQEPIIAHHFGFGDQILDKLFLLYGTLVDQEMANQHICPINILLLLTKL